MKQITKRKMKQIQYFFKEKETREKLKSTKFRHRAPSGDARKREPYIRLIASKVDNLVIVVSFRLPPLKEGLIDRFLVMAELEKINPVIVFNKVDLLEDRGELEKHLSLYRAAGYTAMGTSVKTGEGVEALRFLIEGRVSALAGHSGVGKSSLLNSMFPEIRDKPETREVSLSNKKGKHTTTSITLYRQNGTTLFDMPGLKYASLYDLSPVELQRCFPEFTGASRQCRFDDCIHNNEPSCGVKEAVEMGIISKQRYDSYLRILDSL